MGRRGPPKKPTALKEAQGCPGGKHKLNKKEPRPKRAYTSRAPMDLAPAARTVWNKLAKELIPLGLFTRLDVAMFRRYCDMRARWEEMRRWIDERGLYYAIYHPQAAEELALPEAQRPQRRVKYLVQWPQVGQYNQLNKELARIEQQFGMTPASRSSIIAPERTDNDAALAEFERLGRERHVH